MDYIIPRRTALSGFINQRPRILYFYAVIDGVYWLTYLHLMSSTPEAYDQASEVMQSNRAYTLSTALEFVLALVIILRARYIANFLYKVAR